MAIKDLPGSTVLNFKILLDQLNLYIEDIAESKAGGKPRRPKGMDYSKMKNPWLSIRQGGGPQAQALMSALYATLQSNIKVTASDSATFSSKYTSKTVWANNFFIIRTQIVGVVNQGDPVLVQFDALWTKLESITGKWSWGK